MGFTRYYEIFSPLDKQKFAQFSQDCNVICEEITKISGHGIAGYDGYGDPRFTEDIVSFNGIDDNAHESFAIDTACKGFYFTKTQLKPYDLHVEACLELAKYYFGEDIRVSSDADEPNEKITQLVTQLIREKKIGQILS